MEIIGIKDVNFVAKDGGTIQGLKLFVTDDSVKVSAGVACDSIWLSPSVLEYNSLGHGDFHIGNHLLISYNKYGRIQSVSIQ